MGERLLTFRGVAILVGGEYTPPEPSSIHGPEVAECFELHSVKVGGCEILPLLSESMLEEIETIILWRS